MNFCMRCGSKLQPGNKFCGSCGWKVEEMTAQAEPKQEQEAEQAYQPQPEQEPQPAYQRPQEQEPQQPQPAEDDSWDEFEIVEPAQPARQSWGVYSGNSQAAGRSPYARPVNDPEGGQRPAYSSFGQQQSGYSRQRPAGQVRPAYGNGYSRPQQEYNRPYGQGRPQPPVRNRKPKNQGLLKLLSLVFALGLLVLSVGGGASIYLNRGFDKYMTDNNSVGYLKLQVSQQKADEAKKQFIKALLREDPAGIRNSYNEIYSILYGYQNSVDVTDQKMKDYAKAYNEKGEKENNYRWTIVKVGAYGNTLIIAGGICAGVALLLWLILGGTTAGFTQTTMMPLLVTVLIWIVGIMLVAFAISPVDIVSPLQDPTAVLA